VLNLVVDKEPIPISSTLAEFNLQWEQLMLQWPEIFYYRYGGRKEYAIKLWGIQCDLGWCALLSRFLVELDAEARRLGVPPPRISQIKEKLGSLRIRFVTPKRQADIPTELRALVLKYGAESMTTCEVCGDRGRLNQSGYRTTRCEAHQPSPQIATPYK